MDIFAVQDEITGAIVAAIAPELGKTEQQRATSKKPENLNAWEAYQRGMWHLYRRTRDDLAEARRLFATALSLDHYLAGLRRAGVPE
jgi:adenylate cyclase